MESPQFHTKIIAIRTSGGDVLLVAQKRCFCACKMPICLEDQAFGPFQCTNRTTLLKGRFQPMVHWWFGLVVWDSRGAPNNPFHKGIPRIQTTNLPLAEGLQAEIKIYRPLSGSYSIPHGTLDVQNFYLILTQAKWGVLTWSEIYIKMMHPTKAK